MLSLTSFSSPIYTLPLLTEPLHNLWDKYLEGSIYHDSNKPILPDTFNHNAIPSSSEDKLFPEEQNYWALISCSSMSQSFPF